MRSCLSCRRRGIDEPLTRIQQIQTAPVIYFERQHERFFRKLSDNSIEADQHTPRGFGLELRDAPMEQKRDIGCVSALHR